MTPSTYAIRYIFALFMLNDQRMQARQNGSHYCSLAYRRGIYPPMRKPLRMGF